jgi:hypothetical protein
MTNSAGVIPATPSGNGITFTSLGNNDAGIMNGLGAWSGTDATGGTSWTLTCTATSNPWGFTCLVMRNVASLPNNTQFEVLTSAPQQLVENFTAKCGMLVLINDSNGIGTGFNWLAADGYTPTSGNGGELLNAGTNGSHAFHAAYYPSMSRPDQLSYGLDTATTTSYAFMAIEIEGLVPGSPVSFRSNSSIIGTGGNATATEPAGTVQGDLLVALFAVDNAGQAATATPPSGWRSIEGGSSATREFVYNVSYIIRGSSAPNLTFTHDSGSVYRELLLLCFSNADSTWPIDSMSRYHSWAEASTYISIPDFTPYTDGATAVAIGMSWAGAVADYIAPPNYTIRSTNGSGMRAIMATKNLGNAAYDAGGNFQNSDTFTFDHWGGVLMLARSGASRPTDKIHEISEYEASWGSATTPRSVPITISSTTDVLVVCAATGNGFTTTFSAPTGGTGITWTLQQSYESFNYNAVYVWTATNISPQTFTLTMTASNGSETNGFSVHQFANASVGSSTKTTSASGIPSATLTTTSSNSAILTLISDFAGIDGVDRVWQTSAGPVLERSYYYAQGDSTTYVGLYPSVGAAGSKTVGLSDPVAQKYNMIAIEIAGNDGAAPMAVAWFVA